MDDEYYLYYEQFAAGIWTSIHNGPLKTSAEAAQRIYADVIANGATIRNARLILRRSHVIAQQQ